MMIYEYCLGMCPYCRQGVLIPVMDGPDIRYVCTEAFHTFDSFDKIEKAQGSPSLVFDTTSIPLDVYLKIFPNMKENIFIFKNQKWVSLIDDTKALI